MRAMKTWAASGLILLSLTVAVTGFRCAEVVPGWGDDIDGGHKPDGGDQGDGGDMEWHCFTGTAQTEDQLLNHCTEAERIERATNVPASLWDPQTPLP